MTLLQMALAVDIVSAMAVETPVNVVAIEPFGTEYAILPAVSPHNISCFPFKFLPHQKFT